MDKFYPSTAVFTAPKQTEAAYAASVYLLDWIQTIEHKKIGKIFIEEC